MEPNQNPLIVAAQQQLGALPAIFQNRLGKGKLNADLAAGITAGFPILSFRGKAWRVKFRGEERVMVNDDGTPKYAIDVVILKTSPHIAKKWYEAGYVDGSNAPPDCWSVDGKKPDPASPKLQSATCAGCKWNAWGSSRTQGGTGKGKDCADSKRIALAPLQDIDNEAGGGPLLLQVPPASLSDLLAYANSLEMIAYPYYAVGTRLSFDVNAEYPKLMFKSVRVLNEEEAEKVAKWQDSEVVERILNAAVEEVKTDGTDTTHTAPAAVPPVPQRPVQQAQQAPVAVPPTQVLQPETKPVPAGAVIPIVTNVTPKGDEALHDALYPVPVDPNAERRKQLRAMNFDEKTIEGLLGPEPKTAPAPEDPRIAQLRGLGFTEDQIKAALGATAAPNGEGPKRRGRPAKPKEASTQTQAPEPAPPTPEPVQAAPEPPQAPAQAGADVVAGFDNLLDQIMAGTLPGQS
jgi:hypothetical protein